jgi:hypothetical protein
MTPGQQRKAERAAHLAAAFLVVAYVYLPLGGLAENLIRWVALPALVASGVAMWQAARLRRALKRVRAGGPSPIGRRLTDRARA